MKDMLYKVSILVFGKVQKVGFRNFVQKQALINNISGWVKNLESGSVSILAEGKKKDLDAFLEVVKKGNERSSDIYINLEWNEQKNSSYKDFQILL